jgi:hypothetical protein
MVKKILSLSLGSMYGLLGFKQKVYSDWGSKCLIRLRSMIYSNKVYITTSSGVCQAQTRIQEQRLLRSNQKCGALRVRYNVYSNSDWSTWV